MRIGCASNICRSSQIAVSQFPITSPNQRGVNEAIHATRETSLQTQVCIRDSTPDSQKEQPSRPSPSPALPVLSAKRIKSEPTSGPRSPRLAISRPIAGPLRRARPDVSTLLTHVVPRLACRGNVVVFNTLRVYGPDFLEKCNVRV